MILPNVFIKISSMSKIPTFNKNCNNSIVNVSSILKSATFINLLFLGLIIGKKKPNGVKANTLPNILTIKLSQPKIFLYSMNLFISLNKCKL